MVFLGKDLILNADSLERWNPEKISSPIKFIFWSIYYIFFGGKLIGSFHTYIGNVLNLMTPIFISIFILPTFLIIFTKKNNKKVNYFILFGFIFSILSGGIVFFYFYRYCTKTIYMLDLGKYNNILLFIKKYYGNEF